MQYQSKNDGYTLVEMLTVVAIIAILGAVAVVGYQEYTMRARAADILLKYDAIKSGIGARLANLEGVDDCAQLAANFDNSNLADAYATLAYGFEAANGGYRPVLTICAKADAANPMNVKVAKGAYDTMAKINGVEANPLVSESLVSFALPLTSDKRAVCSKNVPASSTSCGAPAPAPAAMVPAPVTACGAGQEGLPAVDPQGKSITMCVARCPSGQGRSEVIPTQCCPTGDLIDLTGQKECLPPCPSGQKRSDADPTKCEALTPKPAAPSLKATQDFAPYPDPRFPELVPGESAVRGAGSCDSKIEFYISGGTTTRCVLDPQLVRVTVTNKPTAANNPCPKGYVFAPDDASTDFRTPAVGSCVAAGNHPAPYDPMTCQVCAGPEFLCEKLIEEGTCEYPNNFCVTTLTNRRDTSRTVIHRCGNYRDANNEWFLGSSDDDKCRQFDENNFYTVDMQCTYACIKDNCNAIINPTVGQTGKGSGGIMWFPSK